MTNSLLIGKVIYDALMSNDDLQEYVEGRIYPLVAQEGTSYPFIVYWRDTVLATNYSKDGYNEDSVTFTVVCVSDKYSEGVEIANEVRFTMEKNNLIDINIKVSNVRLTDVDEAWSENGYVQTLNFTCTVN